MSRDKQKYDQMNAKVMRLLVMMDAMRTANGAEAFGRDRELEQGGITIMSALSLEIKVNQWGGVLLVAAALVVLMTVMYVVWQMAWKERRLGDLQRMATTTDQTEDDEEWEHESDEEWEHEPDEEWEPPLCVPDEPQQQDEPQRPDEPQRMDGWHAGYGCQRVPSPPPSQGASASVIGNPPAKVRGP